VWLTFTQSYACGLFFNFKEKKGCLGGGAIKTHVERRVCDMIARGAASRIYLSLPRKRKKVVKVVVVVVVVVRLIGSFVVLVCCSDRRYVRAGDVEVAFVQFGLEYVFVFDDGLVLLCLVVVVVFLVLL